MEELRRRERELEAGGCLQRRRLRLMLFRFHREFCALRSFLDIEEAHLARFCLRSAQLVNDVENPGATQSLVNFWRIGRIGRIPPAVGAAVTGWAARKNQTESHRESAPRSAHNRNDTPE